MFSEFEKYKNESWKDAALHELKGKNFEEVITWKTKEGFEVSAFYQANEVAALDYLQKFHTALAQSERQSPRNCQQIKVINEVKANQVALEALNYGCNEIAFDVAEINNIDFDNLLKEILLPYCIVSFFCKAAQAKDLAAQYLMYAQKRDFDLATLTGAITITDQENADASLFASLLEITNKASNLLTINILDSEELITDRNAALLARAVKIIGNLLKEGIVLNQIIGKVQFYTSIGNDYFTEIAGLRALRMLFGEIAKEYGLKEYQYQQVQIHALTSVATSEREQKEPDWNMLSNTTQAMSAVIGGCNALTVLPHNQAISEVSSFSSRIARNVSNLLMEESYFDKTIDIGAGSYYIDTLTDKVASLTWEKFQKLCQTS